MHQPGKNIYISEKNENALLFTKVPIRPTKTGGSYVSVFDLQIFFFIPFIYLNVHTFCAEHCCSIFLIFKVTLFAIVSLEKWHTLLWAPKWGIELRHHNCLGGGLLEYIYFYLHKTGLSSYLLSIGVMIPTITVF